MGRTKNGARKSDSSSYKRPRSDHATVVVAQPSGYHTGPKQMDFEMAVKKAVMKEKSKNANYVDLANAGYAGDTTGSITLIATIAQGVSVNQRLGKKAAYKSLQIRGNVTAKTTTTSSRVCWMVIYDRKPTNALPAITDVLVNSNQAAFLNDVNSDRFQVVRRMDYQVIGNSTTPSTGCEAFMVNEYIDLKKRLVEFNAAATGAIGDIAKGALYFITVGGTAAGTAAVDVSVGFRTRFIEIEG